MDIKAKISQLVERARLAQKILESGGQEAADRAVLATAWAVMEPGRNLRLSELAVRTTGLGNAKDKFKKNHRKTLGLLRDLKGVRANGIVKTDEEKGIVEIARPAGVVCAVVPSTNPVATPVNKIINALKCCNAVIVSPSPKGAVVLKELLTYVHAELESVGLPVDLVQSLPDPISKEASMELMVRSDLVVCTGSQKNVRAAYACGTPAFGVGAGNVTSIIDETADCKSAAEKIAASKTFDNATSCSSENNLILLKNVYDPSIEALRDAGGVLLDGDEKKRLEGKLWKDGKLSPEIMAQSFEKVCLETGFQGGKFQGGKFFMVAETGVGKGYSFSGEKLSLALSVYQAENFESAVEQAEKILNFQGKGHSVGLHTGDASRAKSLGLRLPVCRVIVNQPHCFATGGSFENGLPFSLSMGCGTWGGNGFSENMNYRHYMNTTRVVMPAKSEEPDPDEFFEDYFRMKNGR